METAEKLLPEDKKAGVANRPRERTIATEVGGFVTNVSAIRLSLDEVLKALTEHKKSSQFQLREILEKSKKKVEKKEEGKYTIKMEFKNIQEFLSASKRVKVVGSSIRVVKEGHLLSLVSKWDEFIAGLLRIIYKERPEIISGSERALTFSEMNSLESIDDARSLVIDMEIESVLRDSHADQFSYLEKKLGVKLKEDAELWSNFIEITQRRNLIAHAGGRVSKQYVEICRKHGCENAGLQKIGSILPVELEYVSRSADCLIEIGIKLSRIVWSKILPKKIDDADRNFLDMTYELINEGEYVLAIKLLDFFVSPPVKHADERSKLMAIVNLAQAQKWANKEEECQKTLKTRDWSVLSDDFKLAEAVLCERYEDACKIMKRIGKNGAVVQADYDSWPIFQRFREQELYAKTYRALFGDRAEVSSQLVDKKANGIADGDILEAVLAPKAAAARPAPIKSRPNKAAAARVRKENGEA